MQDNEVIDSQLVHAVENMEKQSVYKPITEDILDDEQVNFDLGFNMEDIPKATAVSVTESSEKFISACPFQPPMSAEQSQYFKLCSFTPQTNKKMLWAVNMYDQWRKSYGNEAPDLNFIHDLNKLSVCSALCQFISQVKRMDGNYFPGHTLYEIIMCIQIYLESHGLSWKLLDDNLFKDLKNTLDNVMKQ